MVVGLALRLVFGIHGWFGIWCSGQGVTIIYAVPGMALATVFVSLPFVVREVAPVLAEIGDEQEQAAATLGPRRGRPSGASPCRRSAGAWPTA